MFQPAETDFHALIEAMPLCILLHDAQTKEILWANSAALQALGFSLEELVPLKAPDMTNPAPKYRRSIGLRWLEGAARTGQRAIEWCYRSKQGVDILSEATATLARPPQRLAVAGEPGLLQPAQRDPGRRVAGQHHQAAALVEQPLAGGAGQVECNSDGSVAGAGAGHRHLARALLRRSPHWSIRREVRRHISAAIEGHAAGD